MIDDQVEGRRGGRSMSGSPSRPSDPPMQRPPAASTVSSPTLPVNYLSLPKLPPSIASPSSTMSESASASVLASDLCVCTPIRSCLCAAHPCPGCNRDYPSSLQLLSPPPSFFIFGDGFCDMCTFFTRGYREAGPVEKNLVGKTSSLG